MSNLTSELLVPTISDSVPASLPDISNSNPLKPTEEEEGTSLKIRIQQNFSLANPSAPGDIVLQQMMTPEALSLLDPRVAANFASYQQWELVSYNAQLVNAEKFSVAGGALKTAMAFDASIPPPQKGAEAINYINSIPSAQLLSVRSESTMGLAFKDHGVKFTNAPSTRDPQHYSYPPLLVVLTTPGSSPQMVMDISAQYEFRFTKPLIKPKAKSAYTNNFIFIADKVVCNLEENSDDSTIVFTSSQEDLPKQVGTWFANRTTQLGFYFPNFGRINQVVSTGFFNPADKTLTMSLTDKYVVYEGDETTDTIKYPDDEKEAFAGYITFLTSSTITEVPPGALLIDQTKGEALSVALKAPIERATKSRLINFIKNEILLK